MAQTRSDLQDLRPHIRTPLTPLAEKARGIGIAFTVGFAASFLGEHYSAPAMLFALLLGMSLNFIADDPRAMPGIEFSGRTLLRIGVALLGFRIALGDILALGPRPIFLLLLAVLSTIVFGILVARLAGLSKHFGADSDVGAKRPPLLPGFLTAFVVITLINSFIEIPAAVTEAMSNVSRQCLITAIAAIGLKIDMKNFLELGRMPVVMLVAETIWLAVFIMACLLLLR